MRLTRRFYRLTPFGSLVYQWPLYCLFGLATQRCTVSEPLRTEPYESGIIVLDSHQQNKPGSVAFINRETGLVRFAVPKAGTIATDIFANSNDRSLTDTVFSHATIDGKDFLVVPGKDAVEIVEGSTFRSISLIGGAESGRYVVGANSLKGYVSYWGGKTLSPGIGVVDLVRRRIVAHITTSAGPEQMAVVNGELFVAHSGGSSEVGRTLSVINTTTDQLVATIPVGDVPTSVVYDNTARLLYVLCSGRSVNATANGQTTAELLRINPDTRQIISRVSIGGRPINGNPSHLVLDPNTETFYFLWRKNIYKIPASATSIPLGQPLINRPLTTFGFDPVNSVLYGAGTNRSAKPTVILRYKPTGTLIDSITTEAQPTGFYAK
jgi:YVTN family beta-propeller protein